MCAHAYAPCHSSQRCQIFIVAHKTKQKIFLLFFGNIITTITCYICRSCNCSVVDWFKCSTWQVIYKKRLMWM